jgi:hypothetical protein
LSAARFSLVVGVVGAAAFGFFLTKTPLSDFLISFLAGTFLPFKLSEVVFTSFGVGVEDKVVGGGLLAAFSRAATALQIDVSDTPCERQYLSRAGLLLKIHDFYTILLFPLSFLVFLTLPY